MDQTKYTLSDLLAELGMDINNLQGFLWKLNQILSTNSDSVEITQTRRDGTVDKVLVPSVGFLAGQVKNIESRFESLLNSNNNVVGVKDNNGNLRKFELKNTASLIKDLERINQANLGVPTEFRVKNNWFFESFLNPLLFISVNVEQYVGQDIDRFEVKRLIVNTEGDDDKITYFDQTYKAKNDISYNALVLDLSQRGISYNEDSNIVDLPPSINRARGSFDVMQIFEEDVAEVIAGQSITSLTKKYKLNTLQYTYLVNGRQTNRFLQVGDTLILDDGTEFEVKGLDKNERTVILTRVFGLGGVTNGANVLRIKPQAYKVPELQINLGFNEREVIFVRPISSKMDMTTDFYSNGFGIYSNELQIKLQDGSVSTLDTFYQNFVSDFGLLFMNYAKEKKIPATLGAVPTAPVLNPSNFKVVMIDSHLKDTSNSTELKNRLGAQEKLRNELKELDKSIDSLKADLNTNKSLNNNQKLSIQKDLDSKTKQKSTTFSQLSTVSKEITLALKTTPEFAAQGKYKVRGFWEIPSGKDTDYGKQEIVQFRVRFKYLSKKGTSANAEQFSDIGQAGNTAFFSNYEEFLTKARSRDYDTSTGTYTWADENISDPEEVNTNQLDISIRKGESVQIQIKSLSEAGWPDNPIESPWSDPITIDFPDDIQSQEESSMISQEAFAEASKIGFQEELESRGLDIHLQSAFTTGDKYYSHRAEDIASGFFTPEGNVVNLYQIIKNLSDEIASLKKAISTDKGIIKVSIFDKDGNQISVSNGQEITLFAGFYRDLIKNTSGNTVVYEDGKIINTQYSISIENSSQTPLELVSFIMGGMDQPVPTSYPGSFLDADYNTNRRYDKAPLTANDIVSGFFAGLNQKTGYQSSQVKSQFMYLRYMDYGLGAKLYSGDNLDTTQATSSSNPRSFTTQLKYDYRGRVVSGSAAPGAKIPFNAGHYLPYDPTFNGNNSFSPNTNVFSGFVADPANPGLFIASTNPGYLTEFCIHKSHPKLEALASTYTGHGAREIFVPTYNLNEASSGVQKYLPFSHGLHFDTTSDVQKNLFGTAYFAQAEYNRPIAPTISTVSNTEVLTEENYPIKLSFEPNDEYLIGRYTCGAYLFLMPGSRTDLAVDGNHPILSRKQVAFGPENAINIPLVFQFRCSDKLGFIGGFRFDTTLKNVKYTKKIGIDLYLKGESPFSFDISVECQYQRETATSTPIIPNRGKRKFLDQAV